MSTLIRKAFVMHVRSAGHEEYRRRHDALWPELGAMLSEHGVRSYDLTEVFHVASVVSK